MTLDELIPGERATIKNIIWRDRKLDEEAIQLMQRGMIEGQEIECISWSLSTHTRLLRMEGMLFACDAEILKSFRI